MLTISVIEELWDSEAERFKFQTVAVLEMEHSLVALSKWEAEHEKPFLGHHEKDSDELLDYVKCMVLGPPPQEDVWGRLTQENMDDISAYIDRPHSGTTFKNAMGGQSREIVSAEIIYYYMISLGMTPDPYETWHLNRLFTQLRVFSEKNGKGTKRSRSEVAAENSRINEERRAKYGTSG